MKEITCLGKITICYFNKAPNFEHDHYNHNGPRDYDDKMSKEKIEAPTFDTYLDPWVFIDWLRQMEKFFDYYHWAENKKVRYARMKLIGRADLFWEDLEDTLRQRHEPTITNGLRRMMHSRGIIFLQLIGAPSLRNGIA